MKAKFFITGLAMVPLALLISLTPCSARPQHVRGHRHSDHVRRAEQPSASSGSSLYINTVGVTSSNNALILSTSTVAVNTSLEPSATSLPLLVPFVVQQATPVTLADKEIDVSQASEYAPERLRDGPDSRSELILSFAATIVELNATCTGTVTKDSLAAGSSIHVASATLHDTDRKIHDSATAHLIPRASAPSNPGDGAYQSFVLPSISPTSSSVAPSATATSLCPAGNGTSYTSDASIDYTIICGMDYEGNIEPFYLVKSFAGCIQKCDAYNYNHGGVKCFAAIYVPARSNDKDDCYLKSSLNHPLASTGKLEGALRLGFAKSSTSASSTSHTATSTSSRQTSSTPSLSASSSTVSAASPTSSATASNVGVTYATGTSVIVPSVASSHLHGTAQNQPSTQYINMQSGTGINLAQSLLVVGVNGDLTTGYDLSSQTGILQVNISTQSMLSPLKGTPHLSRDGGRGGYVNGQHLFIFCDTGSYSAPTASTNGDFHGFVSSSVAIDVGMNGLYGKALSLQDGIGEWSDDVGRMRGFAPLTLGEFAYNQAMQGNGQRYAIWPEASLIPLDAETSLMYAPIVYDNVNMATRAAVFTYTGNTLLTVTAGGQGGPVAQRAVEKIFDQNEVEYGCGGGIRSWGPSGIGGDDGKIYIFGIVSGGVLLGRTSPSSVADRKSYQYWNGNSWGSEMQSTDSKAFFISGPYMDIDVFYSPRHLTFIAVYMTIYADSTFYYRYLKAPSPILPPYAPGGNPSSDYVENLTKYPWSDQQVLYKASPGKSGKYIYSGGVQSRYYGTDDIYNGGSKMLISWTAPTGEDPASMDSEYQLVTAEIDWV